MWWNGGTGTISHTLNKCLSKLWQPMDLRFYSFSIWSTKKLAMMTIDNNFLFIVFVVVVVSITIVVPRCLLLVQMIMTYWAGAGIKWCINVGVRCQHRIGYFIHQFICKIGKTPRRHHLTKDKLVLFSFAFFWMKRICTLRTFTNKHYILCSTAIACTQR